MCQCFYKFLKCLAVTVNVIVLFQGLTILVAGIYTLIKVDFHKLIGDAYKDNVPSKSDFIPDSPAANATAEKIDSFVDDNLDKVADVAHDAAILLTVLGALLVFLAIFGIVAFTCLNDNWICLTVYLILLLPMFGFCVYCCVYLSDDQNIQDSLFKPFEDVAFSNEPPNRFFMAAVQYGLKCCGVRGATDYFCHGTYDYKCNPGCLTYDAVWKNMLAARPGTPPVCVTSKSAIDKCKRTHPIDPKACEHNLNVPKPIDARKDKQCQNYKEKFNVNGRNSINFEKFSYYDPVNQLTLGDPRVHGAVFTKDVTMKHLYGNRNPKGCGYVAWTSYPFGNIIWIAFITFLVICIVLGFMIALLIIALIKVCADKRSSVSSSSSSSPSSSSTGTPADKNKHKNTVSNKNKNNEDDDNDATPAEAKFLAS